MSLLAILKENIVTAIAGASVIAVGTGVVSHEVTLGRHDERLTAIENLSQELDETQDELLATRIAIAELKGSQKKEE